MKKFTKWIFLFVAILLFATGCSEKLMTKNPLEQELQTAPFKASGTMVYNGKNYNVRLSRNEAEKDLIITGELLQSPIHYTVTEKGLNMIDGSLEGLVIPTDKMPKECIGVFLWDMISELSQGTRVSSPDGIEIVLQDVGMVTADNDKKITGLTFPSINLEITLNEFEYC